MKKYKYFILSSVLHLSILILVLFNFSNKDKTESIKFNTNGSKGVEVVKASVLHSKGSIKKPDTQKGNSGEYHDETRVQSVIKDQSLLKFKAPKYPKVAILNKQQGEVIIRLLVEKNGEVKKIVIYKSSNYALLDNAVLDVAKHWNIKRSLNEISWVQVIVNFMIE